MPILKSSKVKPNPNEAPEFGSEESPEKGHRGAMDSLKSDIFF